MVSHCVSAWYYVRLAGPRISRGEPRRRGLELGGDYVYITVFCFTGQANSGI